MKEAKIVSSFARGTDSALNTKAQFIITSMTGNANFTTPVPTLAALGTARTAFELALNASLTKDQNKISIKNDKREQLIALLKQLVNYVELISVGDKSKLLSSGFDLAKDGSDAAPLGLFKNFTIANGNNSGQMISKAERVENAVSFLHCFTPDPISPNSIWTEQASTTVNYTHTDLVPGLKYWFKMKAIGSKNQKNESEMIAKIVQ
jgi:hypothetical protein